MQYSTKYGYSVEDADILLYLDFLLRKLASYILPQPQGSCELDAHGLWLAHEENEVWSVNNIF